MFIRKDVGDFWLPIIYRMSSVTGLVFKEWRMITLSVNQDSITVHGYVGLLLICLWQESKTDCAGLRMHAFGDENQIVVKQ